MMYRYFWIILLFSSAIYASDDRMNQLCNAIVTKNFGRVEQVISDFAGDDTASLISKFQDPVEKDQVNVAVFAWRNMALEDRALPRWSESLKAVLLAIKQKHGINEFNALLKQFEQQQVIARLNLQESIRTFERCHDEMYGVGDFQKMVAYDDEHGDGAYERKRIVESYDEEHGDGAYTRLERMRAYDALHGEGAYEAREQERKDYDFVNGTGAYSRFIQQQALDILFGNISDDGSTTEE